LSGKIEPADAALPPPVKRRRLGDVIRELRRPKVSLMLVLGIASGLPFALIGNTLAFWLKDAHVGLAAIGFISWVGLTYSIKFVWGALVDRIKAPIISRMGRRRSWMLISQVVAGAGLIGMGLIDPKAEFWPFVALAFVAALGAATQDTAMDAWRIETAVDADELGLLTSAYSVGYRLALIFTESIILMVAKRLGWPVSYVIYGAAMSIGVAAVLIAREPAAADAVLEAKSHDAKRHPMQAVYDAVIGPLIVFFRTHGLAMAVLMLSTITFYHLCDYMRGPMSNPYYAALNIDKDTIGWVRLVVGLPGSFIGIALGGFSSLRLGNHRTLIVGAIVQPLAIAAFALLGWHGGDYAMIQAGGVKLSAFEVIMTVDSIAIGYSGVALISYMSTLTSLGYTATQYALLTSALAITGKFLTGFSGSIVVLLQHGRSLLDAFALFYLVAAALGAPAIVLCIVLTRLTPAPARTTA
jgi:MFS transporter, PAT family, beta-lactamase induction signal transducer AmpG